MNQSDKRLLRAAIGLLCAVGMATDLYALSGSISLGPNSWNGDGNELPDKMTIPVSLNTGGVTVNSVQFYYNTISNTGIGGANTVEITPAVTAAVNGVWKTSWNSSAVIPIADGSVWLYARVNHSGAGSPTELASVFIGVDNQKPQRPSLIDAAATAAVIPASQTKLNVKWLNEALYGSPDALDNEAPDAVTVTDSGGTALFTTTVDHGLVVGRDVILSALTSGNYTEGEIFTVATTPTTKTFTLWDRDSTQTPPPTLITYNGDDSGFVERSTSGIAGMNIVVGDLNQPASAVVVPLVVVEPGPQPPSTIRIPDDEGVYQVCVITGDDNVNTNGRNWSDKVCFEVTRDATPPVCSVTGGSQIASPATFTVDWDDDVSDLTAADFNVTNGTINTITPLGGSEPTTSYTVTVDATDCDVTLQVKAGAAKDAAGNFNASTCSGVVNLTGNNLTASIGDVTGAEGTTFEFVVTLSSAATQTVTIDFDTADGTASVVAGDYNAANGTLTFAPGDTNQTVFVTVGNDSQNECDETFTVTLTNPQASGCLTVAVAGDPGVGTIPANQPLTVSVSDPAPIAESSTTLVFFVSLTIASDQTIRVDYTTVDGTAQSGTDYTAKSGTLTFIPGDIAKAVGVVIHDDTVNECDESFTLVITNLSPSGSCNNKSILVPVGTGTILENDSATVALDGNVTASEGDGSIDFTVSLSRASDQTVSVDYFLSQGSATSSADYTATGGTLTFAPGDTAETISVPTVADTVNECDETFTVTLTNLATSNCANVSLAGSPATGTITDDDTVTAALAAGGVTDSEGNGPFNFRVTIDVASEQTISIGYVLTEDTATSADFDISGGILTFTPGDTGQTLAVPIVNDMVNECDETFTVALTSPAGSSCFSITLGVAQATGTILDDDTATAAFADTSVSENEDTGPLSFRVTLDIASEQTIDIHYVLTAVSATNTDDYDASSGTLTFTPGTTGVTLDVPLVDDTLNECDETFTVTLTTPSGSGCASVEVSATPATGTINDNDTATASFVATAVNADEAAGTLDFRVTLDIASQQTIDVDYFLTAVSATNTDDYDASSGTLTFTPGVTGQTLAVPIVDDAINECDETFTVTLTTPSGSGCATVELSGGPATGTINDNDTATLSFTVANVTDDEANGPFEFRVELDVASEQTIAVDFFFTAGSATSSADYTDSSGTLTFNPGTTGQTVSVTINDDSVNECDETFTITLTSASGSGCPTVELGGTPATGRILDNDTATASFADTSVSENEDTGPLSFRVELDVVSAQTIAIDYFLTAVSATSSADYDAGGGTLTFTPGVTGQTLAVPLVNDGINECDETFTVTLTNPAGSNCGSVSAGGPATGTIIDDDSLKFSINDVALPEGQDGLTEFIFTVTIDPASQQTIAVSYATKDGTATVSGADYIAASGTLTFSPGTTRQTIAVDVIGDADCEVNEFFLVDLTSIAASGCTSQLSFAKAEGVGSILRDDDFIAIDDTIAREFNWVTSEVTLSLCEVPLQSLYFKVEFDPTKIEFIDDSEMEDAVNDRITNNRRLHSHADNATGEVEVWVDGFDGEENVTLASNVIMTLNFRVRVDAPLTDTVPPLDSPPPCVLMIAEVVPMGVDGVQRTIQKIDGSITIDTNQFKVDIDENGTANAMDAIYIYRAIKYSQFVGWIPFIPDSIRNGQIEGIDGRNGAGSTGPGTGDIGLNTDVVSDQEILANVLACGLALDLDSDGTVEAEQDAVYLYRYLLGGFPDGTVPIGHTANDGAELAIDILIDALDDRVADGIDPVADTFQTGLTLPKAGTATPMVIRFNESLRLLGTDTLLATGNVVASGLISATMASGSVTITVAADARTVTVTPTTQWTALDSVDVDLTTVEDVADRAGTTNPSFVIPVP